MVFNPLVVDEEIAVSRKALYKCNKLLLLLLFITILAVLVSCLFISLFFLTKLFKIITFLK